MIGIVAATGFTGRLVASELKRLGSKFFIAARNAESLKSLSDSLGGVPTRLIDVKDASTYGSLIDCSVIINCAGPFTDLGEPIVQAAIAQRSHYLDLTGEQGFIKLVYDNYHQKAQEAGIALVPACAFEYAIGDAIGAQLASELANCKQIELIYHMEGMYTSAGTRKSIIRAFSADGFQFRNGKFERIRHGSNVKTSKIWDKSLSLFSFPAGEVLMLPRHTKLQDVSTYMSVSAPAFFLPLFAGIGQSVMRAVGDLLVNSISAGSPTTTQRQSTKFIITGNATNLTETRTLTASGLDPYMLTAVLIAGVADFLSKNNSQNVGAIAPSMVGGAELIRRLSLQAGSVWTH